MTRVLRPATATFVLLLALAIALPSAAQKPASMAQFLSPGYPASLVSAKKADRIAWIAYEAGKRNVYAAAAPDFRPVRLTRFTEDSGIDLTGLVSRTMEPW